MKPLKHRSTLSPSTPLPVRRGLERIPNLDGLRAIAVLIVMLFHSASYFESDPDLQWVANLFNNLWSGPLLFFVLSGFLVGSLAFREIRCEGRLLVGKFWMRRIFRTWPLYFVLLLSQYIFKETPTQPGIQYYLTFTQNFTDLRFFVVTWSLAVEEQFYLIFPLVLLFFIPNRMKYTVWLFVSLVGVCFLYRRYAFYKYHTLCVMDGIMYGLIIAYAREYYNHYLQKVLKYSNVIFLLGLACAVVPFLIDFRSDIARDWIYGGLGFGYGCMVLAALDPKFFLSKILKSRFMYRVALYSYGAYLVHPWILFYANVISEFLGAKGWIRFVVLESALFVLTMALSAALYYVIEKPALSLRDRWFSRPKASEALASPI